MKRSDFRFLDRLRVRWAEVDMQKIVFNGHYLMYFDTAVAGYWRSLAMPYHETMERLQGDLYVRKATLEYLDSARYDDILAVGIRCGRIGTSSCRFDAAVFRADQCLVHGELVYVFADPATQTSKPVPPELRALLEAFEAGETMLQIRVGTWTELGPACRTIRQAVLVDELGAPAALAGDESDDTALHALAVNRFDAALACGRLLRRADGVSHLGRVATIASMRGGGIGAQVVSALVETARQRGDRELLLAARADAATLYERAGFAKHGPVYEEAGLPHVEMRLAL
jgi:YbgC/YbaW family acyl-CoA thioester hydrolase